MNEQLTLGYGSPNNSILIENKNLKIKYYENYFNSECSHRLMSKLATDILWKRETTTVWGKKIIMKRNVAWYGDEGKSYTYSGLTVYPNKWNEILLEIKARIEDVSSTKFNSVIHINFNLRKFRKIGI